MSDARITGEIVLLRDLIDKHLEEGSLEEYSETVRSLSVAAVGSLAPSKVYLSVFVNRSTMRSLP